MIASRLIPGVRLTVYIAAGDPISRDGLASQLRGQGIDIVERERISDATVALMVADDVDEAVIREIRAIRRSGPDQLVLVAARIDDAGVLAAAEAGATAIVRRRDATPRALGEALRRCLAGEGTLPADLVGRLMHHVGHLQRTVLSPRGLTLQGLTERELQVLRLLAEGLDTVEVGRHVCLSERTVKNVIHDITTKLNLRNRTHAVAYALREGWI